MDSCAFFIDSLIQKESPRCAKAFFLCATFFGEKCDLMFY